MFSPGLAPNLPLGAVRGDARSPGNTWGHSAIRCGGALMRTVTDEHGTEWTVFEVRRQGSSSRWSYLPAGFESGWLCFESRLGKKRLTPVPGGWRRAPDDDVIQMLRRATPVNRTALGGEDRANAD